jgi:hypothetical protein
MALRNVSSMDTGDNYLVTTPLIGVGGNTADYDQIAPA